MKKIELTKTLNVESFNIRINIHSEFLSEPLPVRLLTMEVDTTEIEAACNLDRVLLSNSIAVALSARKVLDVANRDFVFDCFVPGNKVKKRFNGTYEFQDYEIRITKISEVNHE